MKKREAQFTLLFRHYLKANPIQNSAVFELKQTINDSIPFNVVKDHQINALKSVKSKYGFLYKISDDSIGIKPFDMVYYFNSPAFVVIKYPECFVIIDIDDFILERNTSKRKSLTSDRATKIATHVIPL